MWTLAVPAVLCVLLLVALSIGGWWVERVYLGKEHRFDTENPRGATAVRAYGARFQWLRMNFSADSLWIRSPALDVRTGKTVVGIDWIGGVLAMRPAARLDADSAYLRTRSDTAARDTTPLDSVAFPDFAIPLAVRVGVLAARIDDDSGLLAEARGVSARTRGGKAARARVQSLRTRWTGDLDWGAAARADWSQADSVDLKAEAWRRDTTVRDEGNWDRLRFTGRNAKLPLWKGRDSLALDVRDAEPYLRMLRRNTGPGTIPALPGVAGIRLRAATVIRDSLEFALRFSAATGAHRVSPDFAFGPQAVTLDAVWKRDRGSLVLESRGPEGEDVRLEARGRWLAKPPGRDSATAAPLWERAAVSLQGHARGLKVRMRDTVRTADARIERAEWNGHDFALAVVTGDSSRVEASGTPGNAPRGRDAYASFALHLNPEERWLKVFLGETVSFRALDARGEYARERLTAMVAAQGVTAYGFRLDSVRSYHEYGPSGYTLKPSRLYADSSARTLWTLSGTVTPAPRGKGTDLAFALENTKRGKLTYALAADGTMTATATSLEATSLPYPMLDTLPLREGVLDGFFVWNPARKTGRTDLRMRGLYRREKIEARIAGSWDARRMELARASLLFRKSELNTRARIRLDGKQFYELGKLKPNQYERVSVETPGFNIAEALQIFQTDPALMRGSVKGELTYAPNANGGNGGPGFSGALIFDDITPPDAPGDAVLKSLRLEGLGDTLIVSGRTESATVPAFNASLRVAVTGALADSQQVRAEVVSRELRIRLDAVTRRFQSLRGVLGIAGSVQLPEGSGSIEDVRADLDFNVPFPDPLTRATLTTRAFEGTYVLPGLTRQHFSLDPSLRDGLFRVARLTVKNDQGQSLTGNLEYSLRTQNLKAHLEGDRFVAQWGDDYKADLQALSANLTRDSAALHLEGAFARGTFLFADPPLRATGTLTNVNWGYTLPSRARLARDRREENPPVLRLSGNLSESLVRYRLKSLGDIQRLFNSKDSRKGGRNALRLNVRLQTLGNRNRIDSDILRLTWVGNLSVKGVHPYTLFDGRVNAIEGGFGLERQAYDVTRLEVKWLNTSMEEGLLNFEARKNLASTCRPAESSATDSCTVITRLGGTLEEMQFSYDSDCGGAFGAGASVAAILYSVQRGCYDPAFSNGDGRGYGEKALTLLEPTLNRGLSSLAGRYTGAWIETMEITGLGALSGEQQTGDTLGQPLSIGLTSREYRRLRLKIRSGYHTSSQDLSNPWEHMLAVEWRPPMRLVIRDSLWLQRFDDHLRAVASLRTLPVRANTPDEDEVEKKIGLNYSYPFWGEWWSKKK